MKKPTLAVACIILKSAWQAVCRPFWIQFRRLSPLRSGSLRSALAALMLAPLAALHAADAPAAKPENKSEPKAPETNASKVPKFNFAKTLPEQEEQLKSNPLMLRFAESRRKLAREPHRPIYHFVVPEGHLCDPNALCFWQGRWHLFTQTRSPIDRRGMHWGHAVSDDLIHWRDLPYAIYPGPEKDCYYGNTFVEDGRVIACYFGVDAGMMVAVSDDPLLLNWDKLTGKAVIPYFKKGQPKSPYNIFDPCIWKKDGMYYALTASTARYKEAVDNLPQGFLHRSKDLVNWEYLHPFVEHNGHGRIGDDGAMPNFLPIGDKYMYLHHSHSSGTKYMLGDYDKQRDKFVATHSGAFTFGAGMPAAVHGGLACPDGKGGLIAILDVISGKPGEDAGDAAVLLPKRLTLRPESDLCGKFNPLNIEPTGNIESPRGECTRVGPMKLPANQEVVLETVRGNAMEIVAEIAPQKEQTIELNLLRSSGGEEVTRIQCFRDRGIRPYGVPRAGVISIDTSHSSEAADVVSRAPESATVELAPDEPLKLRIFIDRSVVEVFVNGRQCLAVRVYPKRAESVGVPLHARGKDAVLTSLDAFQMKSIYE